MNENQIKRIKKNDTKFIMNFPKCKQRTKSNIALKKYSLSMYINMYGYKYMYTGCNKKGRIGQISVETHLGLKSKKTRSQCFLKRYLRV